MLVVVANLVGCAMGALAMTLINDVVANLRAPNGNSFFLGPIGHLGWRFAQSIDLIHHLWGFVLGSIAFCCVPMLRSNRWAFVLVSFAIGPLELFREFGNLRPNGSWHLIEFSGYGLFAGLISFELLRLLPIWFQKLGSTLKFIATNQFSFSGLVEHMSKDKASVGPK